MAIAFVDAVATNFADTAASPHAHARTIAVGDAITVIITASQISNTWATLTGLTDNGAGGGNTYTKQGSTITATGMKSEIWTTIATVAATSISFAYSPSSSGQWTMASMRRTGVVAIGALVSATGNTQASAVIGSPVTQDPNNWIDYIVMEGASAAGAGYSSLPTPLSTFTRRMNGGTWETVGSIDNMGADADLLIAAAGGSQTLTQPLNFANDVWIAFALELRSVLSVTSAPPRQVSQRKRMIRCATLDEPAGEVDATWTHQRTGPGNRINYDGAGNVKAAAAIEDAFIFDNQNQYPPDQYVRAKIGPGLSAGSAHFVRVTARATGVGDANYKCYYFKVDGNSASVGKIINDVATEFAPLIVPVVAGDWVELWVVGDRLMLFLNSGDPIITITDSSLLVGSAGMGIEAPTSATIALIAEWEAGAIILRAPLRRASSQQRAA